MTPQPKEYWSSIEDFMKDIDDLKVDSLVLVALVSPDDESGTRDVLAVYQAGPFELMNAAGTLQLHAGYMFNKINADEEDEQEDAE